MVDAPRSAEDLKFDQIITALQEIVIDHEFEKTLSGFMKNHCAEFGGGGELQAVYKRLPNFVLGRGNVQSTYH